MISLCLTHYNRPEMLYESFAQLIDDDRVSEIVIVDDCSEPHLFSQVKLYAACVSKIKLYRNETNLGCYRNKREAVSKATNEWLILGDSDNVFDKSYVDRLELDEAPLDKKCIFQPEFGTPSFDWTCLSDQAITRRNIASLIEAYGGKTAQMLNAMNYFVHRDSYLEVWEDRAEPWTADSLLQAYNWIASGRYFYVVPGLRYTHRIHPGSHYQEHHKKTGNLYEELIQRFKQLS